MLSEEEKRLLRATVRGLAGTIARYRERREQLRLMGAVAKAVAVGAAGQRDGAHITVVEAPTGTGKSAALSVAGLVMGHTRRMRVVLSTSTVALMEQLRTKDIPLVQHALPFRVRAATMKGRQRYACVARLHALGGACGDDVAAVPGRNVVRMLLNQLDSGAWNGEYETLPVAVADGLWRSLTADDVSCTGQTCRFAQRCPYMVAAAAVGEADIVITNHHYLLRACGDGTAGVLPAVEDSILLLDEAHSLPDAAVGCQARSLTPSSSVAAIAQLPELAARVGKGLRLGARHARLVGDRCAALARCLGALDGVCAETVGQRDALMRLSAGPLPAALSRHVRAAAQHTAVLLDEIASMRSLLVEHSPSEPDAVDRVLGWLSPAVRALRTIHEACALLLDDRPVTAGPPARWIERSAAQRGDWILHAAPVSGADYLRTRVWERAGACALTSATMRTCGSFAAFLRGSGLDYMRGVRPIALPSPYTHFAESLLLVPRMQSTPRDAAAHTAEVCAMLPDLICSQGTLVLFASDAQMRAVFHALPETLKAQTLMQGTAAKSALLATHRARIGAGQRSILFGLASFAEGIDLPGRLLEHVIVAKLPFAAPDSPVESARAEALTAQGRSYFAECALPEAGLRLAQAVGRLVRSETDRGVVTILDTRIATTAWGRRLLDGLPPMRRVLLPARWEEHVPTYASDGGACDASARTAA